jgi:signal transduction histidine kinase
MEALISAHQTALESAQLQRLLEISTTLSSTLDLQALLRLVIEVATELTDTEVGSILLVDKKTGELQFAAATGAAAGNSQNVVVPMEGSIAGWIVRNGQPLIIDDVQMDRRFFRGVDRSTKFLTRTMLGVPLITKGKVIGALEAINKRGERPYTEQDVAVMQALASQAAVAIENARLFQQSDVVAEIMHELKTPLMAVTAASDLLNRPELPENKRADLLRMIRQEATRLSKMTQAYLDLARLESGRANIRREPVNVLGLVEDVVALQQAQANGRNVTIRSRLPAENPPILGDADRLKQVLLNLVSNAIKYNVEGGRIIVEVVEQEEEVALSVIDTGKGIAPENLARLFERFYRVPDSEGYSEGTGLGLSIARKILEEHGGRIEVESEVGRGTTFRCVLPLVEDGNS